MQFLDQPIEFSVQPKQPLLTATALLDAHDGARHWRAFCKAAHSAERRLIALWASDERDKNPAFGYAVHMAFDLAEGLAVLSLPLSTEQPEYPDVSLPFPAAGRMQRAAYDLLGVASDADDQRPWLRHANWPVEHFPLRRDTADARFPTENEDYAFVRVEGDGVHEVAVGPIHAGIIEPGHFRFSVMGEDVLRLEERLGWKHKGIERCFAGASLERGTKLAGRVSGDSTVAYAWAYSQAAEAIANVTPPPRALWLRALLLERERIANHFGDLGYLGNDVALSFGLMQFMRLKEDWLRLNARLFGHRLLMDCVVPGGVTVELSASGAQELLDQTQSVEHEVRTLKRIYDEHAGLQDRFLSTGRITPPLAARLGLIGLAGRASAQWWDLRSNHPCTPYDVLKPKICTERNGDVAARALVRFAEIKESLSLIRKILRALPPETPGPNRVALSSAPNRHGFGWIEGWRGDVFIALETDADGMIRRCHAHDPSWQNWPVLEHAVIGNIVPDFPLINKSFNLSYAGVDL